MRLWPSVYRHQILKVYFSYFIHTFAILLPKQLIALCVCVCVCVCMRACVCAREHVCACTHVCVAACMHVYFFPLEVYFKWLCWGISNILHGVYLTYCSSHRHEWAVTGNGYGRSYTNRLTYLISHLSY